MIAGGLLTASALPAGWRVVGAADADGDGQTDLYLQSDMGQLGVWFFDGAVLRYGVSLNPGAVSDPLWRVRAVGDFNHDGHPDLVWQYGPTGRLAFWLLNGTTAIGYAIPSPLRRRDPIGMWSVPATRIMMASSTCSGSIAVWDTLRCGG